MRPPTYPRICHYKSADLPEQRTGTPAVTVVMAAVLLGIAATIPEHFIARRVSPTETDALDLDCDGPLVARFGEMPRDRPVHMLTPFLSPVYHGAGRRAREEVTTMRLPYESITLTEDEETASHKIVEILTGQRLTYIGASRALAAAQMLLDETVPTAPPAHTPRSG